MSVVTSHRLGEPCWVDYFASDVPRARAFYEQLFGWTAEESRSGEYVTFRRDGRAVAGLGPRLGDVGADAWLTYLLVDPPQQITGSIRVAGCHACTRLDEAVTQALDQQRPVGRDG